MMMMRIHRVTQWSFPWGEARRLMLLGPEPSGFQTETALAEDVRPGYTCSTMVQSFAWAGTKDAGYLRPNS